MSYIEAFNKDRDEVSLLKHQSQFVIKDNQSSQYINTSDEGSSARFRTASLRPTSRRISFATDIVASIEEEENKEIIEDIISHKWSLYRLSPLHNVQDSTSFYKSLSEDLTSYINLFHPYHTHRGGQVGVGYSVRASPVPGLRGSREDPLSLKFEISLVFQDRALSKEPEGILYALGVDVKEINFPPSVNSSSSSSFKNLPVLLAKGKALFLKSLLSTLESRFDTVITPLELKHGDLTWMFALWSGISPTWKTGEANKKEYEETNDVILRFNSPVSEIDSFEINLTAKDIRKIWLKVHDASETEFTINEVNQFYDILFHHLENEFSIQFSKMNVDYICIPSLSANRKGIIKIQDASQFKVIIQYLTELCQGSLLSTNPRMGIEI